MTHLGEWAPRSEGDPAYPTTTPPDAVYACQTREPIVAPLDGVAVPALWSRLADPLGAALLELARALSLGTSRWPVAAIGLQYGRIVVNAHVWEQLGAVATARDFDPSLMPPEAGPRRLRAAWRRLRGRRGAARLAERLTQSLDRSEALVRQLGELVPADLELLALARGPLHTHRRCVES